MSNELEVKYENSTQDLIRYSIEKGADLEKLEKLLTIKERYDAMEAKKAFHKAVSEFKKNPLKITKDKKNSQYNSMYTTLGNLVNTVNPELSKHGLSASWEIKQNGTIEVSCVLTHTAGHSERTSASAPADISGSKNAIQQIKSTITYLKAVTFESITGLASSDANYDDDGNAIGTIYIDEKELSQITDMVDEYKVNLPKFLEYMKIESLNKMPKTKFHQAVKSIQSKVKK